MAFAEALDVPRAGEAGDGRLRAHLALADDEAAAGRRRTASALLHLIGAVRCLLATGTVDTDGGGNSSRDADRTEM